MNIELQMEALASVIYSCPLHLSGNHLVDIAQHATNARFRFVDCQNVNQGDKLCILECSEVVDVPDIPYAAISYVWRGIPGNPNRQEATLSAKGAEDGDPISVNVLREACTTAWNHGARYLWLDRFCILQTSKQDKAWQIAHMHQIYERCHICLVLPGGLQRLADLTDETDWIHRAWTLQETLLPKAIHVLYSWPHANVRAAWASTGAFWPEIVTPNHSATSPLNDMLRSAIAPPKFELTDGSKVDSNVYIFGRNARQQVMALTTATTRVEEELQEGRLQAIWRSALMRTSSRPVDMVFSIMGIFGVVLDTRAFDSNDRLGATIALAKALSVKGSRADWLAATLELPPARSLSCFAEFPSTSVAGKAYLTVGEDQIWVPDLIKDRTDRYHTDVPFMTGMDDNGYVTLKCRAALVEEIRAIWDEQEPTHIIVTGGKSYDCNVTFYHSLSDRPSYTAASGRRMYAISLGNWKQFAFGVRYLLTRPHRGILVEEHAPGRFHRIGWLKYNADGGLFDGEDDDHRELIAVGGPEPLSLKD